MSERVPELVRFLRDWNVSVQKNLTDRTLAALKPAHPGHRFEIVDIRQTGLRVRIAGKPDAPVLTWSAVGKMEGRKVRSTIGRWPTVSLADARHEAASFLGELHDGINPAAEKRAAKAKAAVGVAGSGIATLGDLVNEYERQRQAGRTVSGRAGKAMLGENLVKWRRHLDNAFGHLFDRTLADLQPYDIERAVADRVERSPGAGRNSYANFRPIAAWAKKHKLVGVALAELSDSDLIRPSNERDVVVADHQLEEILPVLESSETYGAAIHFALLTAARRGEVEAVDWRDVDLPRRLWHKPMTKSGTSQTLPISLQAAMILETAGPKKYGLVFASQEGTRLSNWGRALKAIRQKSGTEGWHIHDLRRTAATVMARLGNPPVVIKHVLGHSQPHGSGIAKVYQRYGYETEQRSALQQLADHLDAVADGQGVVVPRLEG